MKYLVFVLLLTGCATPETMRTAYDEELCSMSTFLMDREARHAWLKEQERRNIECMGPAGFAYPPGSAVLITQ
jgi:hypothetical protein